jgi:hypothetical protein
MVPGVVVPDSISRRGVAAALWWRWEASKRDVVDQSAWEYARSHVRDASRDGPVFGIYCGLVGLASSTLAAVLTRPLPAGWQAFIVFVAGALGAYVVVPVSWALTAAARAPVKQRNELRRRRGQLTTEAEKKLATLSALRERRWRLLELRSQLIEIRDSGQNETVTPGALKNRLIAWLDELEIALQPDERFGPMPELDRVEAEEPLETYKELNRRIQLRLNWLDTITPVHVEPWRPMWEISRDR